MNKHRIGIIGCGGIANGKHMPSLKALNRADLVAFCDLQIERAEKAAREFGTPEAKVYKNDGTCVYLTLFMGRDAFGILDIDGEGQEMIIKSCAEVGGPLEQFGTVGYKFCHGAKILYQERLLRVESGSSLGDEDDEN